MPLPSASYVYESAEVLTRQQAVADAYYVLSDPKRRAEYDQLFRSRPSSAFTGDNANPHEQDRASSNFFEEFSRFFQDATGAGAARPGASQGPTDEDHETASTGSAKRPDPNGVFGDVFEEL